MVVFPLGKLIYLGMKQISKPIANQLKLTAKRSPFFSKYICAPPAQGLHRLEMFVRFRLMGAKGPVEYTRLSSEKAVELGAEMIGELFLYGFAASYIFYEYWKGVQRDKERDNTQDEQGTELDVLHKRVKLMEKRIEDMNRLMKELEQKSQVPSADSTTVATPTGTKTVSKEKK